MSFKDFNFKLVVIDALVENGVLTDEINGLEDEYGDLEPEDENGPIAPIKEELDGMELSPIQLEKVTHLTFDGGNDIYQILAPQWNGEDDQFTIKNISGCELLPNLESFTANSMLHCDDLSPLLNCPKLRRAHIPESLSKDDSTIQQLIKNGVEVKRSIS